MRALILALGVVIATASCDQMPGQNASAAGPENRSATTSNESPPQFELRDFRLDKEDSSVGPSYKGRGTIVTKDPRLASGKFFVFLSARQAHDNDEEARFEVLLTEGIGTVVSYDFLREADKDKAVKYHSWEVLGYIPLLPGQMADPTGAKPVTQN